MARINSAAATKSVFAAGHELAHAAWPAFAFNLGAHTGGRGYVGDEAS